MYVFDRGFYNDSDVPKSIKVPDYFNIKVFKTSPAIGYPVVEVILNWLQAQPVLTTCNASPVLTLTKK